MNKLKNNTETYPVYLGTILEGYAAGLVNICNKDELCDFDTYISSFYSKLMNHYKQEFPETTLKEVYDVLCQEKFKFTEDEIARLSHITLNYVKHDVEEAKVFEKWFVKTYKKLNLSQLL